MRAAPVPVALVALLTTACGFSFQRRSEVLDRRVLAIQAEPPELIADGSPLPSTVVLTALVVDPGAGATPVAYAWRSCTSAVAGGAVGPNRKNKGQPDPTTGRCDEADADTLVTRGERPLVDLSALEVAMPIPPSLGGALQVAASRGFAVSVYVSAQLFVANDVAPLYAFKRVVVSPPLPAGRKPNRNPHVAALLFDDVPWSPDQPLPVKLHGCDDTQKTTIPDPTDDTRTVATCVHRVTPAFDANESEAYAVQQFDGQRLDLKERLRFDWYVDQGTLVEQTTREQTEFDLKERDPLSTRWNEPAQAGGLVTLWVVVRDGRGGESWEQRQVDLSP